MVFRRKRKARERSLEQAAEVDSGVETNPDGETLQSGPEDSREAAPEDTREAGPEGDVVDSTDTDSLDPIDFDRGSGPLDLSEADEEAQRIDLGGIQVPVVDELEIRVEVDPQSKQPAAVTLLYGQGAVQLRAISAPRSGGAWEEARSEIKAEIQGASGEVQEFSGDFGIEIGAEIVSKDESGKTVTQRLRIVGVEGPRWMLQGIFYGHGADPLTAGRLNDIYRSVVVVRGEGPMPAGQPLAITVPDNVPAEVEEVPESVDDGLPNEDGYQPIGVPFVEDEDYDRGSGPFDIAEAEIGQDRLDLGSLQILFVEDLEVNLEIDEDGGEAMSVTLVHGQGAVRIRAFSAAGVPRSWEDARSEIKSAISRDGGLVDEVAGTFGTELRAQVPAEDEDGKPFIQPIRLVGVNGPGWMLQGSFFGEGVDPTSAAMLETIFRSVVVNAAFAGIPAGSPLPILIPEDDPDGINGTEVHD